jgi:MFS family permease
MRSKIYTYVFFLAFAEALLFSVNSPYIASLISSELVGVVYSLSSLAAIVLLWLLPSFVERAGPGPILITLLLAAALGSFLIAGLPGVGALGALVLFLSIPQVAPAVSDIFIESASKESERGGVIGSEFTVMNAAFLISPVIGGLIIAKEGFGTLYAIAGGVFILAGVLSLRFTKQVVPERTHTGNTWRGLIEAWERSDLRYVLLTQFLLQFFFSWMVIYTPLYLIGKFDLGYESLGVIFSLMLLPYVLLEYPLGKVADNKLGEKELLTGGFILAALTTAIIPLIGSGAVWVWAVILFGTRVGAAMVEGMSATYFYKKVTASDINLIALFRDMRPIGYILGPVTASLVLVKLPIGHLFPILGGIMLLGALAATRLHDTR